MKEKNIIFTPPLVNEKELQRLRTEGAKAISQNPPMWMVSKR